jgi:hypothetical protein
MLPDGLRFATLHAQADGGALNLKNVQQAALWCEKAVEQGFAPA